MSMILIVLQASTGKDTKILGSLVRILLSVICEIMDFEKPRILLSGISEIQDFFHFRSGGEKHDPDTHTSIAAV